MQISLIFVFQGCAMAKAVSRRLHIAEAQVRSQAGSCEICGGQRGTGTGFSPNTSVFPCHCYSTNALYSYALLLSGHKQVQPASFPKSSTHSEIGKH
jgi:hypothetical protein